MKRPHISVKTKVDAVFKQVLGCIYCPLCLIVLEPDQERILEHMTPHVLGGASDKNNLRWVHKECAAKKTNGTKATAADGDLHKIAKAKRLERARKAHEDAVLGKFEPKAVKPKSRIPSRPFPKKQRGFR